MYAVISVAWMAFAIGSVLATLHHPSSLRVSRSQRWELDDNDIVLWDRHSLLIRGERIMIFSGEFHPFRLPSPGLWLDVFQKIKSMGFSAVSFYVDWSLVEGTEGTIRMNGVFNLEQFFAAASEAGIYLLARPGPYINAETAAGGFPGWLLRDPAVLRSYDSRYLNKTDNYISYISKVIGDAEIYNGGPIVMMQPENEYTTYPNVSLDDFPNMMNQEYMAYVEKQFRNAGVTVPFFDNDNEVRGDFSPTSGQIGALKDGIYGIDAYPLYYDCGTPYYWPDTRFPTNWQVLHQEQSPTTPFMIAEFQGGAGDGWGGVGEDLCAVFINNQAVRILFKNNFSFAATLFNVYMIFGGTNWGNLGYEGGYTSYDYGAAITEDRHVWREKFSEMKLEANFLKVSPAYLTANSSNVTSGIYTSTSNVSVTKLSDVESGTRFYVVRQTNFSSFANISYTFNMSTSAGNFMLPQLGKELALNGRDSKIFVSDYDVGGVNLVYSTADIFTWAKPSSSRCILIMYGDLGETHELALPTSIGMFHALAQTKVIMKRKGSTYVVQWDVTMDRQVITFGGEKLQVHLLWRNDAYNHWALELPAASPLNNFTSPSKSHVIIKAGYLIRGASVKGGNLNLSADFNETTTIEVIAAPAGVNSLSVNGENLRITRSPIGNMQTVVKFDAPEVDLPNFLTADWKMIDSLPEIHGGYDDALWTRCNHTSSTNDQRNLTTPTSLYASDYGYHCGSLIYRGHFNANGNERYLNLSTSGGTGYGLTLWINRTFVGSWIGSGSNATANQSFALPTSLNPEAPYVLTVLIDHMGQTEEAPGTDTIKFPYGILDYELDAHPQADVIWKMTGNLGGENYRDLDRGPRNEGAMFAERQGFHLPQPPDDRWTQSSPISSGLKSAGVNFYTTQFQLNVPQGYDVPMSFVFGQVGDSTIKSNFRCQLFVNGYQFGKYVNNLGPQTAFPIPEGILNHHGTNYIALSLWSLDPQGAKLQSFELRPQMPVLSGYQQPALAPMPIYVPRKHAY